MKNSEQDQLWHTIIGAYLKSDYSLPESPADASLSEKDIETCRAWLENAERGASDPDVNDRVAELCSKNSNALACYMRHHHPFRIASDDLHTSDEIMDRLLSSPQIESASITSQEGSQLRIAITPRNQEVCELVIDANTWRPEGFLKLLEVQP